MRILIKYITTILYICALSAPLANAEDGKRYEVDGVAVGDTMEDVLQKWGLSASDVTVSNPFGSFEWSKIKTADKETHDKAVAEWDRVSLKRRSIDDVKKGNAVYNAKFNQQGILYSFVVAKYYENIDLQKVTQKLRLKYGPSPELEPWLQESAYANDSSLEMHENTFHGTYRGTYLAVYREPNGGFSVSIGNSNITFKSNATDIDDIEEVISLGQEQVKEFKAKYGDKRPVQEVSF